MNELAIALSSALVGAVAGWLTTNRASALARASEIEHDDRRNRRALLMNRWESQLTALRAYRDLLRAAVSGADIRSDADLSEVSTKVEAAFDSTLADFSVDTLVSVYDGEGTPARPSTASARVWLAQSRACLQTMRILTGRTAKELGLPRMPDWNPVLEHVMDRFNAKSRGKLGELILEANARKSEGGATSDVANAPINVKPSGEQ
jgi:hypothetical protein